MICTVRGISDWLRAKPIRLLAILAVCGWQSVYGQTTEPTPQQTNEKIQQLATLVRAHPADSPIGSGDLLHIDVFDVPELSRDVRVGDGGDISYPLVPGKIQAAGLTPFELEGKIEQLLIENGLVTHPQVSVFVKEQNSQPVSVVGAVVKPAVYQVIRPTTLLELLADAGGGGIIPRHPSPTAYQRAAVVPVASSRGNENDGASAGASASLSPGAN